MDLTNEAYNAVNRYFSILKHTGYKVYSEVEKLFVFLFIEELLTGPLSQFVTDEDYKSISNSLYCLYGSCMMPFPDYKKAIDSTVDRNFGKYRISENGILRNTETYNMRVQS